MADPRYREFVLIAAFCTLRWGEITAAAGRLDPRSGWKAAVKAVGVPHLRFHDLRHTGNALAARTKVSTTCSYVAAFEQADQRALTDNETRDALIRRINELG